MKIYQNNQISDLLTNYNQENYVDHHEDAADYAADLVPLVCKRVAKLFCTLYLILRLILHQFVLVVLRHTEPVDVGVEHHDEYLGVEGDEEIVVNYLEVRSFWQRVLKH